MDAAENIYIFDLVRDQVDTAGRQLLQQITAETDGKLVEIHAPEDPGSAGKNAAFNFEQVFSKQGYKVTITKAGAGEDQSGNRVYGRSKVMRAYSYSKAVNSKRVFLVLNADGSEPEWHKPYKEEVRFFPNSTYKDQVDCSSDGYFGQPAANWICLEEPELPVAKRVLLITPNAGLLAIGEAAALSLENQLQAKLEHTRSAIAEACGVSALEFRVRSSVRV